MTLATLATALCAAPAAGQAGEGGPSIVPDDLRPPLSPALVLLDVAPAAVQRPTTPRALAAALLLAAGAEAGVPRDVALEVAPYWLVSHPQLGFDDYYGASVRQNLRQHLSISLASSPRLPDVDDPGTTLGLGVRTLPLAGRPATRLRALRDSLLARQLACLDLPDPDAGSTCAETLRDLALAIQRADHDRYGLLLEVAAAYTAELPGDVVGDARPGRAALWVTPSYRSERGLELMLLTRYQRDHQAVAKQAGREHRLDVGARGRWSRAGLALSLEAVGRVGGEAGGGPARTARYGGMVEYRAGDGTYLFYGLGKDFAAGGASGGDLISLLGLSLGAGGRPRIPLRD